VFRLALFGEAQLQDGQGQSLGMTTRKALWLLAYLILHPGPQTRERLAGLLWPDSEQSKADANFRQAIHSLRSALEPTSMVTYFSVERGTIQFNHEGAHWVDTIEFDRLLKESERASEEERARCLKEAIALYRGDLLLGCYDEWSDEIRRNFFDRYLMALNDLVLYYSRQKDYTQAIQYAKLYLSKRPIEEEVHRQLMYLYSANRDRTAALQQFHECEQILKKELNAEPLPETKALYREIEALASEVRLEELATQARELVRKYPELGAPFVGRVEELKKLITAWDDVTSNKGRAIVVSGEAGVGKSRLADEFFSYAAKHGSLVFRGRCYEIEGKVPYQSLVDALRHGLAQIPNQALNAISTLWLSEVMKLLPELGERVAGLKLSADLLSPEQERNRRFEGLFQLLNGCAKETPLVLYLDDLQWADETSLQFMHYMIQRLSEKRIFFFGTYRSEEVTPDDSLWSVLQQLIREQRLSQLALQPLQPAETEALVKGMLKSEEKELDELGKSIFQESKGVPFFTVELVKSFIESRAITLDEAGHWKVGRAKLSTEEIPSSVRALVETRLRRLSRTSRPLVDVTAVVGHFVTAEFLMEALGMSPDNVFDHVEELLQARIIIEAEGQYNFRHDVIREVVYNALQPQERRKQLHQKVGRVLEHSHAERLDSIAGELAFHYVQCSQWQKALKYSLRAGELAWKSYAKQAALDFFYKALDAAQRLNDNDGLMKAYKGLGQVHCFTDKHEEGLQHCFKALDLSKDPHEKVDIYDAIVNVYNFKRDWGTALKYCDQAIKQLGENDRSIEMVRILNRAADMLLSLREFDKAIEYCLRSLKLKEFALDSHLAQTYSFIGSAYRGKSQYNEAIKFCLDAINLAENTNDIRLVAESYDALGRLYLDQGNTDQAVVWYTKAASLCENIGWNDAAAWIHNNICFAYMKDGNVSDAIEQMQRALTIWVELENHLEIVLTQSRLAVLYAVKGEKNESIALFENALNKSSNHPAVYRAICASYTLLGNIDEAIAWILKGLPYMDEKDIGLLNTLPLFDGIRRDPRFNKLVTESAYSVPKSEKH
jgi:DNA-binding SARP family transcriptional activator